MQKFPVDSVENKFWHV